MFRIHDLLERKPEVARFIYDPQKWRFALPAESILGRVKMPAQFSRCPGLEFPEAAGLEFPFGRIDFQIVGPLRLPVELVKIGHGACHCQVLLLLVPGK
jgi:hypothetical protein